ncbi:hypothetical protein [Burkholderia multivorans]|uniref:hypothetical protein n=1 Tax=Burkholderia multivorans TaxID=87883 RepID=UPI001C2261F7|nr:hypothetical protein [Burkholderia multivorans]MBU9605116.1 hypothetical protein [Burkholderia multivorans]MBU9622799.1 hypothetical protein [Burkholderia multivorans]
MQNTLHTWSKIAAVSVNSACAVTPPFDVTWRRIMAGAWNSFIDRASVYIEKGHTGLLSPVTTCDAM